MILKDQGKENEIRSTTPLNDFRLGSLLSKAYIQLQYYMRLGLLKNVNFLLSEPHLKQYNKNFLTTAVLDLLLEEGM